jgi:hypothetical protein
MVEGWSRVLSDAEFPEFRGGTFVVKRFIKCKIDTRLIALYHSRYFSPRIDAALIPMFFFSAESPSVTL